MELERESALHVEAGVALAARAREGEHVLVVRERQPQPAADGSVPMVGVLTVEEHAAGVRQTEDTQPLREAQPQLGVAEAVRVAREAVAADAAHGAGAAEIGRLVERVQAEELSRSHAET